MSRKYIWQHQDWAQLTWREEEIGSTLAEVHFLRGKLFGIISLFGFEERSKSMIDSLTEEIVHSSEIEGERLNRDSVRSSVARQLGLGYNDMDATDHYVEGVVQVMMDATQNYKSKLTAERLFGWHSALFPNGYSGINRITVGDWRQGEEPMQVVSGPLGHQKVHYEAPKSSEVAAMMRDFFDWIESEELTIDPLVKAGVAHLRLVTIHPFDDGNGRLSRTVTEMLLSRADETSQRYYSLSSEIMNHRRDYYEHLERAQKGSLDITEWIQWFLLTLKRSLDVALSKTENTIRRVQFWDKYQGVKFNERQRKVLNLLLEGMEGKLNSSKWYKINHCSQDTAIRDLNDLVQKNILRKSDEGGRSTTYELVES